MISAGLIPENELTRAAGIELSETTKGAVVDDNLMSSLEGVFSCGNVLHVHDLVDYVSEEAEKAGKYAAQYIRGGQTAANDGRPVSLLARNGVRYTVPQEIRPSHMEDTLTVRFRVGDVYKTVISAYM